MSKTQAIKWGLTGNLLFAQKIISVHLERQKLRCTFDLENDFLIHFSYMSFLTSRLDPSKWMDFNLDS